MIEVFLLKIEVFLLKIEVFLLNILSSVTVLPYMLKIAILGKTSGQGIATPLTVHIMYMHVLRRCRYQVHPDLKFLTS